MRYFIKEKARQLRGKLTVIFIACKRKDTPPLAKIFATMAIGYALSPIDLIPDFIPVLGMLDDIVLVPLLIALCIKLIPSHIMAECENEAVDVWKDGKPKKWYYAIPIVLLWLLIIWFIVKKIFF